MPGKRMIHEEICESEKLARVSLGAEVLWTRILSRVDDNGNYDGDPLVVYANCLRFKDGVTVKDVEKWIKELVDIRSDDSFGLLSEYIVKGRKYLHVTKFRDHQDLRDDKTRTINFPPHPDSIPEPAYLKTGKGLDVIRQESVTGQSADRPNTVQLPSIVPSKNGLEVEVEVEFEVENEGEVEAPSTDEESIKTNEQWWQQEFSPMFKRLTDVRPKPFTRELESCGALYRKYPADDITLAASIWFEEKGRLDRKQKQWAAKNFLEDVPGIIDDLIDERLHPKKSRESDDRLPLIVNDR